MSSSSAEGLFSQWIRLFGEAITGMAGQTAVVSACPLPDQPENLSNWWAQKLSLGPHELIWIGTSPETSSELAKIALEGVGLLDASSEDIDGTFRELVGQALAGLAVEIAKQLNKEVTCSEGKSSANPPATPAEGTRAFRVEIGDKKLDSFVIHFSPQLTDLLEHNQSDHNQSDHNQSEQARASSAATPSRPATATAQQGRNGIDLLLDVELPVRVSFGKAHLQLRDVLKLTTGSIVELNRSVTEPVDILVNNCVIARGEVVVVDGNYGVRINQIVSRQERLRFVG